MATSAAALAKGLKAIAEEQAYRAGFSFSNNCMTFHLAPFLDAASNNLFNSLRGNNEADTAHLEAATRLFVAKMVEEAIQGGLQELQETTFLSVRATFCPCFPLC